MEAREVAAMDLAVPGSLAAVVGIVCLMEPSRRNGLVLRTTGFATVETACAVLVMHGSCCGPRRLPVPIREALGHGSGREQAYSLLRRSMDLHDELIRLRAMRGLLETRLLVLERAIGDQRQHGAAAPDLLKRVEALLARLEQVNAKLAEIRSRPAAPA
jgi:hypothetical protein